MVDAVERRLAAILAADVVGYSRLMGQDEVGTLATLRKLRTELVDPKIAEHKGRIFKTTGDGFLVEFPSVVNAVSCAVDTQKAMAARNADLPEDRLIQFRIGINLGDVIAEGEDVFGDGVNVATRLEGLAPPGGITVSGTVRDHLGSRLNLAFEDMGEQNLKNIDRPIRVYRAVQFVKMVQPAILVSNKPSIAVLPFANMSSDPEQEHFADGITEDIITELSRFASLLVIARNSSFIYKGQSVDIRRVAEELGARYLLEGSVRRSGDRLRITAQLLDKQTGSHIWGEKYDGGAGDVFTLQDEITRNVVTSVAPQIELAEIQRSDKLSGPSVTAYDHSLKALALFYEALRLGDYSALRESISIAEIALLFDGKSAHALFVIGAASVYEYLYQWGDNPETGLDRAGEIAGRLLISDGMNPKSYMLRAWVNLFRREYEPAIADFRHAMQLNPNFAMNLFSMAWGESVVGLIAEAKEHALLALRLSPRDTDVWLGEGYLALTQACLAEGGFEEARKWCRLAIQFGGKVPTRRVLMISICGHLGDKIEARVQLDALQQFAPRYFEQVIAGAVEVYRLPEHNLLLLTGIRKAGLPE